MASAGEKPVVTRFAPSPTGFLHIGGARTALFNWLYARRNGGQFLLRIEDTDRARSTDAAIEAILDGMRWLGLDWDGDTIYQFARAERHAEVAHQLLAAGHAYRCFLTQDELAEMRATAQAEKRPFRIISPWRDSDPASVPQDRPAVVRLKAPRDGTLTIQDRVQGEVKVNAEEIDDFVLLRSDGTPTYMLSVVVDDHDMGITHVIRGDDHLNNAFRQLVMIRAMGWPEPVYAHVPLIHGSDGAKLSKRHGALGVDAYRDELGFLPEAVNNYLLRLGWGHGDEEIISREQALEWFDIDNVGRSASRFDFKKLENLNGHYMREADDARLTDIAAFHLGEMLERPLSAGEQSLLLAAMPSLKPRAKTMIELAEGALFLFDSVPLAFEDKAKAAIDAAPPGLLASLLATLEDLPDWTMESLEAALRDAAESKGLGLGKVAQPLRSALTGRAISPGIFDVLFLLGREEALHRIKAALTA
ncbi:glutamate--tRNA ligase [Sphingomonas lacunae]|uniref:Glutamate--tRNA ligase n=1 Tax=Sphingomonas lacunae TaxID=2698828 RepID=A0A6M4AX81_9SPHN|nr:glutamate--tRNA ligase [Sphingomonas lacunae]QJQ33717.1 glutamate--tRNA ligase [Sphingomonas lacunae]